MGAVEHRNALFSQKFDHRIRHVTRDIVVMEHPIVSNAWSHTKKLFFLVFQESHGNETD